MEEFIRTQNRIREQFAVPKAVSALAMDRSLYAYTNAVKQAYKQNLHFKVWRKNYKGIGK